MWSILDLGVRMWLCSQGFDIRAMALTAEERALLPPAFAVPLGEWERWTG